MVTSSTALMPSAQNKKQVPPGQLHLDKSNGWVNWKPYLPGQKKSTRLCWLPIELRGPISASHEGTFVVASQSTHQLSVIDFTSMLKSLYKLGFILPQPRPRLTPVGIYDCSMD
jgi:hypothetical protein